MRRDIDEAIQGWPYDPTPGEVLAREVKARDGRTVIQVRVELGLLQLEVEGRPDGSRPYGFASYLDYLRYRAASRGQTPGGRAPSWAMAREHREDADREFIQLNHRRVAWLALARYDKALQDAEHSLALLDFVARHGDESDYIASHERLRGPVILHRTQAVAALALERRKPEEAIDALHEGVGRLKAHLETFADDPGADIPDAVLIDQLVVLEREIRKNFAVEKTLREQLDEAVASEEYEKAARLRDQIRSRSKR